MCILKYFKLNNFWSSLCVHDVFVFCIGLAVVRGLRGFVHYNLLFVSTESLSLISSFFFTITTNQPVPWR